MFYFDFICFFYYICVCVFLFIFYAPYLYFFFQDELLSFFFVSIRFREIWKKKKKKNLGCAYVRHRTYERYCRCIYVCGVCVYVTTCVWGQKRMKYKKRKGKGTKEERASRKMVKKSWGKVEGPQKSIVVNIWWAQKNH